MYILLFVPVIVLVGLALGFLAAALLGMVGTPFLVLDVGILSGGLPAGLFQLGMAVALLGLSVLSAVGLYYTTKGIVRVSKWIWRWLWRSLTKKGRVLV